MIDGHNVWRCFKGSLLQIRKMQENLKYIYADEFENKDLMRNQI